LAARPEEAGVCVWRHSLQHVEGAGRELGDGAAAAARAGASCCPQVGPGAEWAGLTGCCSSSSLGCAARGSCPAAAAGAFPQFWHCRLLVCGTRFEASPRRRPGGRPAGGRAPAEPLHEVCAHACPFLCLCFEQQRGVQPWREAVLLVGVCNIEGRRRVLCCRRIGHIVSSVMGESSAVCVCDNFVCSGVEAPCRPEGMADS
jgi:hypothetical protein